MSVNFARIQGERLSKEHADAKGHVNVRALTKKLGIRLVEADLGNDVSGLLVTNADTRQVVIAVQEDNHENRKRFTIAHEIGHHLLGHQFEAGSHVHVDRGNIISQRGTLASQGVDPKEREANQFAASLLMPSASVREYIENLGRPLTDIDVENLAARFEVSEQAMTIRLSTLRFL